MRVSVKLLGFVFWLFFFNGGQCQECLREDITLENTEQAVKASYKDGETVRVNCMPGFIGMYRLKCENGIWRTTNSRPCTRKKCSHPGDIPNGDFKITKGSEFVFGATVLYTCKKGFEMASRINQRTCRVQGWDNTLPVCESVKCPAIHTDKGVTALGNTEEGSYGDVIHFECESSDKKLNGSSDIHCTEKGEWSDSVPTCKEITCTAPDIPNGNVVERVQEYRKDAILKYRCLQGFKPREGIPRCVKFGWTLNPECDEVTCVLKSTTFGVKKINPVGKTIFRAGERVEITCTETHWILRTKEFVKSFTCQDNGLWDHEPVCEDIRCEALHDPHLSSTYTFFWGDRELGAKRSYSCKSGYDQVAAVATCTRDGWTPNPLCEKMCAAPNIPNAEIMDYPRPNYRISSEIQYQCNTGFVPQEPVQITCNSQSKWTGIQQCTAKQKLCPDRSVENGLIYNNISKEELIYSCNKGYKTLTGNWWDSVTCIKGSWSEEPRCIPVKDCGAFPSVHHGKLNQLKKTFHDGEKKTFQCDPGFISAPRLIKCDKGTWETPVCEVGVHCKIPPQVENALITSKPEELHVDGSSVTYVCQRSFLMTGKSKVFCRNGIWEKTPTCKEMMCKVPDDQHLYRPEDYLRGVMKLGETRAYYCMTGYNKMAEVATCTEDGWTPNPLCAVNMCKVPDDQHLYRPEDYLRGVMKLGETRAYYCMTGYNKMAEVATCTEDGWTPNPLCAVNMCKVPDDQHLYRPEDYLSGVIKLGETRAYYCMTGYNKMAEVATCTEDGWTPNPLCAEMMCKVPDDQHLYRPEDYLSGVIKLGETRAYYCMTGYNKMAEVATCTEDGWTPNPLCAGPEHTR